MNRANDNKALLLFSEVFKSKGGIPVFNQNFIRAFSGIFTGDIIILSINDPKGTGSLQENERIKFVGCGESIRLLSKLKFTLFAFYYSYLYKPKFVVCGHINIAPLAAVLKKIWRIDYITITHGIEVWDIKDWKKRRGLSLSRLVICVSNYTKSKIKDRLSLGDSAFFILPDTIDGEKFHPGPKPEYLIERYNIKDCKVILSICRLARSEKYKGYDKVIESLPRVMEEVPGVKYIIGGSGDEIPRIEALIRDLGLEDKVIMAGFIPEEELVDHYNLCDVFVMPSKGEGFGIVFLEALACGKPVIAGNKDGSRDAVLDGKLGILIDPDNMDQIAEAIINVLRGNVPNHLLDPEYLRKTVLEHYGFDKFTKKVKNLVEKLESCKL